MSVFSPHSSRKNSTRCSAGKDKAASKYICTFSMSSLFIYTPAGGCENCDVDNSGFVKNMTGNKWMGGFK
jgi:hypothetical protein